MSVKTMDETAAGTTVYVYEAPVRVWHWISALCIVVLAVTGYFIANPLPSVSGEASEHFLMGYIRFMHFSAAYIFAIGFVARIYWAMVGNKNARQLFMLPPIFSKDWWAGMLQEVRWYLFLEKEPRKYVGHNPLALLFMFVAITLGGAVHDRHGIRVVWRRSARLVACAVFQLGDPLVWTESGRTYLAPHGGVGYRLVHHAACLCRNPRRHHVAANHGQRHHQRI